MMFNLANWQMLDRARLLLCNAWPVEPSDTRQRFLGYDVYDWTDAPQELIDTFMMTEDVERWRREFGEGHRAAQELLARETPTMTPQ